MKSFIIKFLTCTFLEFLDAYVMPPNQMSLTNSPLNLSLQFSWVIPTLKKVIAFMTLLLVPFLSTEMLRFEKLFFLSNILNTLSLILFLHLILLVFLLLSLHFLILQMIAFLFHPLILITFLPHYLSHLLPLKLLHHLFCPFLLLSLKEDHPDPSNLPFGTLTISPLPRPHILSLLPCHTLISLLLTSPTFPHCPLP